jgi:hypothetical protein
LRVLSEPLRVSPFSELKVTLIMAIWGRGNWWINNAS